MPALKNKREARETRATSNRGEAVDRPTVDVETLSKLFKDLTPRRIQQLAREGIIPKPTTRGRYLLVESCRGYIGWLQERVTHRDAASATRDLREEQVRKARLENDLMEAKLIAIDEVIDALTVAATAHTTAMDSFSGRLAPMIAPHLRRGTSTSLIRDLIDDEQRRIREDLCARLEAIAGVAPLRRDDQAKAQKNRGRMGGSGKKAAGGK